MEKKPIKRNEHIVKLSQDHHASLMFCWKLRQGVKHHVEVERMRKYVDYFWTHHFSAHFKEEEDFLFAPLNDEKTQKAIEDHENIRLMVHDIDTADTEKTTEILLKLADIVDAHVRYEERILFPHIEKVLTEKQLQEIGMHIAGKPLKDNFEDKFWIQPKSL